MVQIFMKHIAMNVLYMDSTMKARWLFAGDVRRPLLKGRGSFIYGCFIRKEAVNDKGEVNRFVTI